MTQFLSVIILLVVAFGIFFVSRTDGTGLEKAMLMLVIAVGGVIGGSIIAALIMTSPMLAIMAIIFAAIFIGAFIQALFGDKWANNNFAKSNWATETASTKSAEDIQKTLANIQKDDIITFGKYQWKVLAVNGNRAFVITKNVILNMPLHSDSQARGAIWEKCTLRKYLNGRFLKNNFGQGEQSLIMEVSINNNDRRQRDPLPPTKDRVYVMSIDEAKKYQRDLSCELPKQYSARRCWLRDTNGSWAYYIDCEHNAIRTSGLSNQNSSCCDGGVRPVMWLKIKP